MADAREYVARAARAEKGQRYYVDDPFAGNRTVQSGRAGRLERMRIDYDLRGPHESEDAGRRYGLRFSIA